MKDNPNEELKKLEQKLLAVEEEANEILPEAEADDDAILFPEEDDADLAAEHAQEEAPVPEEAQVPFVERDEEFEAFYQDILKEFGPDSKPRRKTSSTKKTAKANAYSDSKPAKAKKEKGVKGLVITLCLEMLGIVGVVLWWILRIL